VRTGENLQVDSAAQRGVLVTHLPAEALERSRYPERGARAYLGKLFMPTLPRNALRNALAALSLLSFSPNRTDFGLTAAARSLVFRVLISPKTHAMKI